MEMLGSTPECQRSTKNSSTYLPLRIYTDMLDVLCSLMEGTRAADCAEMHYVGIILFCIKLEI